MPETAQHGSDRDEPRMFYSKQCMKRKPTRIVEMEEAWMDVQSHGVKS